MRPVVNMTVDSSKFDAAMKAYLLQTSRDLHKAVNSRFFYLMVRLFVLVPPKSPGQERRRIGNGRNFRRNPDQGGPIVKWRE